MKSRLLVRNLGSDPIAEVSSLSSLSCVLLRMTPISVIAPGNEISGILFSGSGRAGGSLGPPRAGHRRGERRGETNRLAHFEHGCAAVPVGQLRRHSGRKRLHNRTDRHRMRALMNGMGGSVRLTGGNSYEGDEFIIERRGGD